LSLTNHNDSPFILLLSVDSTNNYAMGLVHAGMAQHGTAVFSKEQTRGRGQRSRDWISEKNSNIALSLIIDINGHLPASKMFLLSKAIALGTVNFFNSYTTGGSLIKWPNDLFWGDRKAGGILIENVLSGNAWKYAVVGVGININQTEFSLPAQRAVSLKMITGTEHDPEALARELQQYLLKAYDDLLKDHASVSRSYHEKLYKLNEKARFRKSNQAFDAIVIDVTDYGELVLQHSLEEKFAVGEIEWIL
jgi:BirA family transcriptional regulator, biotin operon repressor / biotin---[acetyl-CoA-carboxylase] ligase